MGKGEEENRKGRGEWRTAGRERERTTEWFRHSTTQEGVRDVSSAVLRTEKIQFRPSMVVANKSSPKTRTKVHTPLAFKFPT